MAPESPWPEIDPRAALRSLGFAEPVEMEPVTGGWDAAIWRFSTEDGSHHALRIFRSPERMQGAMREKAAMEAAASGGLPVPPVRAFGQWQDLPAMVIDWCPGATLVQCVERRPWVLWSLARQLGQLQARIYALPVAEQLRDGAPEYWLRRLGAGEEGERLPAALRSAGLNCDSFVHMDLHPLNVLSDGRTISGVLDWTNAAAGDVRADLAWTTILLRLGPIPPSPLKPLLRLGRRLFYVGWRRGYESEAGPMPDLGPFLAWAGSVYLQEVQPRLGEAQVWATDRDMEAMRRQVDRWKQECGIA